MYIWKADFVEVQDNVLNISTVNIGEFIGGV